MNKLITLFLCALSLSMMAQEPYYKQLDLYESFGWSCNNPVDTFYADETCYILPCGIPYVLYSEQAPVRNLSNRVKLEYEGQLYDVDFNGYIYWASNCSNLEEINFDRFVRLYYPNDAAQMYSELFSSNVTVNFNTHRIDAKYFGEKIDDIDVAIISNLYLYNRTNDKQIIVPEGITTLADGAINSDVTYLELPSTISYLPNNLNVDTVVIHSSNPPEINVISYIDEYNVCRVDSTLKNVSVLYVPYGSYIYSEHPSYSHIQVLPISQLPPRPEPQDTEDPTDPTDPIAPEEPTEPTEPIAPDEPTEPTTPVEPITPDEPTEPTEPITPVEPITPDEPTEPTEPTTPVEPITPEEPTESTDTAQTTSISVSSADISVYPQPAKQYIYISGIESTTQVTLYSTNGNIVLSTFGSTINVATLPKGLYILKANNQSVKVVIE